MTTPASGSRVSSVFFGTPDFAVPSIAAAFESTQVLAVVTQPDRPRGRGHAVVPCEVKAWALAHGLRVFSPASLRKPSPELEELRAFVASHTPDLLLVTAYGNLLPQSFLDWPRLGPINVHASLLPRWRGAAPIQRALEHGDPVTGVCLQKMVMALDAGDLLAEARLPIDPRWGAPELTAELSRLGGELLGSYLKALGGELSGKPQDPAQVTIAPKIVKEEALWSPSWTRAQSLGRIRAFAAWPKVQAEIAGALYKLLQAESADGAPDLSPGVACVENRRVWLGCADGALALTRVQAPNRGPADALSVFQNLGARPPTSREPIAVATPRP